jgi:Ca2+-binding EF-hand superfamily protein
LYPLILTPCLVSEFLGIAHANPLSLSLKAVFEELDVDGDGHITRSELRTAFQRMGHALTDQDIKAIYKHVDVNQDGKINFQGTKSDILAIF